MAIVRGRPYKRGVLPSQGESQGYAAVRLLWIIKNQGPALLKKTPSKRRETWQHFRCCSIFATQSTPLPTTAWAGERGASVRKGSCGPCPSQYQPTEPGAGPCRGQRPQLFPLQESLLTKLKTQPFVCRALYGFNLACPPKVSNSAPLAGGKNYSDQESPLAFLKITLQGDSRTLAPPSLISSHLGSKQLYSIKSCPGMDPEAMGQPVMDQNLWNHDTKRNTFLELIILGIGYLNKKKKRLINTKSCTV